MNREKQIEEVRKDIFAAFGGYAKWEEDWQSLAEAVYNAGYRKQSEPFSRPHENGGEWISVEVVRCKDCKHYKPQTLSQRWENKTKYCCRGTTVKVKDNDFCSYGEPIMKGGAE